MIKIIRLIVTILFLPIWFPIVSFSISLFGVATMLGLGSLLGCGFMYLIGDSKKKEDYLDQTKDGFYMGSAFIWYPVLVAKQFIIHGNFEEI